MLLNGYFKAIGFLGIAFFAQLNQAIIVGLDALTYDFYDCLIYKSFSLKDMLKQHIRKLKVIHVLSGMGYTATILV